MDKLLNKIFVLAGVCLLLPMTLRAEVCPTGYYDRIEGAADSLLKGRLKAIIRDHTVVSYGSGSWNVFYYADRDSNGNCMDMYCDEWKKFTTPGTAVSGCNVEHSFAKSWWGRAKNDAYKDCYHLNPSNSTANSSRGNYPLGEPTKELKTSGTGSLKVGKATYAGQTFFVFEPKDEYKGDFARAFFYMATCYGKDSLGKYDNVCSAYKGWRTDNAGVGSYYAMQNDNYLEFQDWEIDVLLKWHRMDPVSEKELNRMNAVSDFQHNRNPFIEYPCLVEFIWGNRKGKFAQLDSLTRTTAVDWLSLTDSVALTGCLCDTTYIPVPPKPTPADSVSVVWKVDGKAYTQGSPTTRVVIGGTIASLPTAPKSCSESSEVFVGWTTSPIDIPTDQRPSILYTKASAIPAVGKDMTFYAVFAHKSVSGQGRGSYSAYTTSCSATDLNDLVVAPVYHFSKVIINGQFYILHDGVYYNLNGQPIKHF